MCNIFIWNLFFLFIETILCKFLYASFSEGYFCIINFSILPEAVFPLSIWRIFVWNHFLQGTICTFLSARRKRSLVKNIPKLCWNLTGFVQGKTYPWNPWKSDFEWNIQHKYLLGTLCEAKTLLCLLIVQKKLLFQFLC